MTITAALEMKLGFVTFRRHIELSMTEKISKNKYKKRYNRPYHTSFYSAALIVMVFPLGSSNRSMVRMSIIIMIPKKVMDRRMKTTKRPAQIGTEKNPTQLIDSPNSTVSDAFVSWKKGCT